MGDKLGFRLILNKKNPQPPSFIHYFRNSGGANTNLILCQSYYYNFYLTTVATKDKIISAVIAFQGCEILSQRIINHGAVFWHPVLQTHGSVFQTGFPGSYFISHRQLKHFFNAGLFLVLTRWGWGGNCQQGFWTHLSKAPHLLQSPTVHAVVSPVQVQLPNISVSGRNNK